MDYCRTKRLIFSGSNQLVKMGLLITGILWTGIVARDWSESVGSNNKRFQSSISIYDAKLLC